MAKRRQKHRTHVAEKVDTAIPRSMVIKMGDSKRVPTKALGALVRDFRAMMQPHTAARLRERKANKLKDFLVMAGPLGVSHFFLFSQSHSGNTTLRIARTPRGPTLYFRVQAYSLARDIQKAQARPHAISHELRTPPLLVMSGFSAEKTSDREALLTSMFQNILPSINVQTAKLSSISRVVLLQKDKESDTIELRHYAIVVSEAGASRAVRKLNAAQAGKKAIPSLSGVGDVADYMFDPGMSESEGENEIVEAERPAAQGGSGAAGDSKLRKAVRLVEIGPRLRLGLLKVEDGLCQGKTLFHAIETRTDKEAARQEHRHKNRDAQRAQRRKEQEENVRRKREEAAAKSTRSQRGKERARERGEAGDGDVDMADGSDSDVDSGPELEPASPEEMNDYELDAELAAAASDSDSE